MERQVGEKLGMSILSADGGSPPVTVKALVAGGAVDRTGRVSVGDVILGVNGSSTAAMDYDGVLGLLKACGATFSLTVASPPTVEGGGTAADPGSVLGPEPELLAGGAPKVETEEKRKHLRYLAQGPPSLASPEVDMSIQYERVPGCKYWSLLLGFSVPPHHRAFFLILSPASIACKPSVMLLSAAFRVRLVFWHRSAIILTRSRGLPFVIVIDCCDDLGCRFWNIRVDDTAIGREVRPSILGASHACSVGIRACTPAFFPSSATSRITEWLGSSGIPHLLVPCAYNHCDHIRLSRMGTIEFAKARGQRDVVRWGDIFTIFL